MEPIPFAHEASAGDTNKRESATLPPEAAQCLQNARFLHLGTCNQNKPHVSLMQFTYLPSSTFSSLPVVIMTTNTDSRKANDISANPNVSLLVHDYGGQRQPVFGPSLASFLSQINTASLQSISVSMTGNARLVPTESEEERFYKERHLANNTVDSPESGNHATASSLPNGLRNGVDEERQSRASPEGDAVRVIVVEIGDVRISDKGGGVRDWSVVPGTS